jgi:signal transduction histidine kinase
VTVTRNPGPPTHARLEVADDGGGFDEARRAARAQEGHVGLTLLEDLVNDQGGTLRVRSVPGAGTTVALEVPVA